jgi:hypothetical protein
MIERKLLTIAIPAYRRYKSLSNLLGQIDKQIVEGCLVENIEVLICDDSGHEKSNFGYISPFLSKEYIHYIDNGENIGLINNILKVIEKSSGKYCLSPGDDEELLENKLNDCIKALKELPDNIAAVVFDEQISEDKLVLNSFEAAEKYFWYFGNLGCFVINTDIVKNYFVRNKRNTIWPQTELVFLASLEENRDFCIIKDRIIHSPNHRINTRYNSYYLFEGGFFSLIKTALNLENVKLRDMAIKNINTRYTNLLISMILNYIFNDSKDDTQKTRLAISESKKVRQHIFDNRIYYFNFLSKTPKWFYILVLKILRKFTTFEYSIKNKGDKAFRFNDHYA